MKITVGPLGDNEAIAFIHGGQWTPSIIELWMAAERDGIDEFSRESPKTVIDEARNELYLRRLDAKNILDHIPAQMLIDALFRRVALPTHDPVRIELEAFLYDFVKQESCNSMGLNSAPV